MKSSGFTSAYEPKPSFWSTTLDAYFWGAETTTEAPARSERCEGGRGEGRGGEGARGERREARGERREARGACGGAGREGRVERRGARVRVEGRANLDWSGLSWTCLC